MPHPGRMTSPGVLGVMATQRGLITRAQAVHAGLSPERIDRLVRAGTWVAVRRAVYAERPLWDDLTEWEARQLLRDRAASLRITKPHVLSHTSSALELGLAILRPGVSMTHVTRRGVRGTRHEFGVKHHLAPYREDQVEARDGVLVLDGARTAVDIAREYGLRAGVVACDSARRTGLSKSALVAAYEGMRSWPEVTVARHGGMRVLGFSGISNKANLDGSTITTHDEVMEAGRVITPKMEKIIRGVLRTL